MQSKNNIKAERLKTVQFSTVISAGQLVIQKLMCASQILRLSDSR